MPISTDSRRRCATLALAACVTLSLPPAWFEEAELAPLDARYADTFANALALDGDTAIVGAPNADGLTLGSGAAYVLVDNGPGWVQQAKLIANDGAASDRFGDAIAVDGDTAIVGATWADPNGSDSGAAYVFVRSGTSWTQQAKLLPGVAAAQDKFGHSVAVEGDTAVVADSASTHVFVRAGTTWTEQADLLGGGTVWYGRTLALDGDTLLVGQPYLSGFGYVDVFVRSGTTWTRQVQLVASDAVSFEYFGSSVALDGDTVLVGARGDTDKGFDAGAVFVYVRAGTTWSQQAKLLASDGQAGDWFGCDVAIEGERALIGAPWDDDAHVDAGAAYEFVRSGTTWSEAAKVVPSNAGPVDLYGISLALDGGRALVGSEQGDAPLVPNSGSAYVLTRTSLFGEPGAISVSTGGAQSLSLDFGPTLAAKGFFVLGSASGTTPGVAFGGALIPLNVDPYFIFTLVHPNTPPLAGSGGFLDAAGRASASFGLPALSDPALAGVSASHAAVVLDIVAGSLLILETSAPAEVLLTP